MLKKIDILVLRSFSSLFITTLSICLFVLVMQFFWLWIDDLVGKGLDIMDIFSIIAFVILVSIPLALPLSLLLSSLITYGNLGESMELVALKASGISLNRAFLPLHVFSIFIAIISFIFSNNITPYSWFKLTSIKYEIIIAKPTLDIQEGVFYDKIDGYVLHLGQKINDTVIKNISIFEQSNSIQDNMIYADSGIMKVTKNKKIIELILYNGWRYQERGRLGDSSTEFIKMKFRELHKYFSISTFQDNKNSEKNFYDPKLLSYRQLVKFIDSVEIKGEKLYDKMQQLSVFYVDFIKKIDSSQYSYYSKMTPFKDKNFIPDSLLKFIKQSVAQRWQSYGDAVKNQDLFLRSTRNSVNLHKLELHKKLTWAVTCIIFFFIGASLGSIIKKGGFGLPFVFSVVSFVCFNMLNTIGEKLVKSNTVKPIYGMWLANFIFFLVVLILFYLALNDSLKIKNPFKKIKE